MAAMTVFSSLSDTDLMLAVRSGDHPSFDLLLHRHRGPIVYFLYRMVQNTEIAEELAQDVFLKVYQSRERYTVDARFTTWLYRIATNRALNWIRDHRRAAAEERLDAPTQEGLHRQIADTSPSAELQAMQRQRVQAVRNAVAVLPERQRVALVMHKFEEMDYHKISEVMQCSPQAVKSLLFRAYESLRLSLAGVPA